MDDDLSPTAQRRGLPGRITLISHASTIAVRRAVFPLDEEVEAAELARVAEMGWAAPRAQQVLTAPELRTRQTAEALGLQAVVDESLREYGYGRWSGESLEALQEREPEGVVEWLMDVNAAPHGGESLASLVKRVGGWMDAQRDAGHTVAVTHPAVMRAAAVYALGAPAEAFWKVEAGPLTLTDLRVGGRGWTLRAMGCTQRYF